MLLLGYPGSGKRTVGTYLAELLNGVLIDNQLVALPIFAAMNWEGKGQVPREVWLRIRQVRDVVLDTIEHLAPRTTSYVFTKVLEDDVDGRSQYERFRSLAKARGSNFLAVMLECDAAAQISRIDSHDRIERRKLIDPEEAARHRRDVRLFVPPPGEVLHVDTTETSASETAVTILHALQTRSTT